MLSGSIKREGEPGTSESPKRAKVPTRTKHLGGSKGNGSTGGRKPLKRRSKAVRVLEGNARAEREGRKSFFDHGWREKL